MTHAAIDDPADAALLNINATRALAGGLSESTIARRVRDGSFPRPVVISRTRSGRPCRRAWVRGEVLDWCRAQIAASRART